MGQVADELRKLIENSDDLSQLPQLVSQVETIEAGEQGYQERIAKLQEINKSYLAQIPIPNSDPHYKEEEEEKEPDFQDAKEYLVNSLTGGNE